MDTILPHTRIRTIMKSSSDIGQINNEVLLLITKSTEMFIKHLARESYNLCGGCQGLFKYDHLAEYVNCDDRMGFLLQILPKKITVKEFRLLTEVILLPESSSEESDSVSEAV